MNSISYVVNALPEPALCLQAANALRDLCDANRLALAPHICAFAELHAGLTGIPVCIHCDQLFVGHSVNSHKSPFRTPRRARSCNRLLALSRHCRLRMKSLPLRLVLRLNTFQTNFTLWVQAIVSPVVQKLVEALNSSAHVRASSDNVSPLLKTLTDQLPEEARMVAILQLQTLTGVAKGLTRTADSLLVLDESPAEQAETDFVMHAREDIRMVKLREALFSAISTTVELWCTDASVSDVSILWPLPKPGNH
jgi:hypothetical protein